MEIKGKSITPDFTPERPKTSNMHNSNFLGLEPTREAVDNSKASFQKSIGSQYISGMYSTNFGTQIENPLSKADTKYTSKVPGPGDIKNLNNYTRSYDQMGSREVYNKAEYKDANSYKEQGEIGSSQVRLLNSVSQSQNAKDVTKIIINPNYNNIYNNNIHNIYIQNPNDIESIKNLYLSEGQGDKSKSFEPTKINQTSYTSEKPTRTEVQTGSKSMGSRVQDKGSMQVHPGVDGRINPNPMGNSVSTGKLSKATEKFLQNNYINELEARGKEIKE